MNSGWGVRTAVEQSEREVATRARGVDSAGLKERRVFSWTLTNRKPGEGGRKNTCLFPLSPGRLQWPHEENDPKPSAAVCGPGDPSQTGQRASRTLTRHHLCTQEEAEAPAARNRRLEEAGGSWGKAKPRSPSSLPLACPHLCMGPRYEQVLGS